MHLSPAFLERYGPDLRVYQHVEFRTDGPPVESEFADLAGEDEVQYSFFADDGSTADGLQTIASALRLLAAVSAVTGAMVVALALIRLTRVSFNQRETLVALGSLRGQIVGTTLLTIAPWVAVGALAGAVLGAAMAPRAMVGLAAQVDPESPQLIVEPLTLLVVAAATVALGVIVIAATAARTTANQGRRTATDASPRSPRSAVDDDPWGPPGDRRRERTRRADEPCHDCADGDGAGWRCGSAGR